MTLSLILACALVTTLAACGGGSQPSNPAASSTVPPPVPRPATWVEPQTGNVLVGETVAFSIRGLPTGGASTASWSISGSGCSENSCGTIDSRGLFVAPLTVPYASEIIVTATSVNGSMQMGQASIVIAASADNRFMLTGSMVTPRVGHTATLLRDGRVLITGGRVHQMGKLDGNDLNTAELYDPATSTFSQTGPMNHVRAGHTATLLDDGQVLITGPAGQASAELYDPVTGGFSLTGSLRTVQRSSQRAALLPTGKVLVVGDVDAELYEPAIRSFTPAAAYAATFAWIEHAVPLVDGRVLMLTNNPPQIYDPARNSFATASNLISGGGSFVELATATLLTDGRVLIAGGTDEMFRFREAQLYDPTSDSFSYTGLLSVMRDAHAAVRLADGRVLVLGGDTMSEGGLAIFTGSAASAELYDPRDGKFRLTRSLNVPRTGPQATLLQNGNVLVTGGIRYCGIGCFLGSVGSAELYHVEP